MVVNGVLTGCDLDEFWWSKRKPSYALTCWLLFSIPVFHLWNVVIMWLKVERHSRNSDYKLNILHSPVPGVMILCTAVPFSSVGLVSWSLPWSALQTKPMLCAKPKVAFRFINKEITKSILSHSQGSFPRTSPLGVEVLWTLNVLHLSLVWAICAL